MPQLPEQFLNSLKALPDLDLKAFAEAHEQEARITSVRLNPYKKSDPDFLLADPIPWCEGGYYLGERPSFTLDPLFHAGAYYVQEPGSMFLQHALKQYVDFKNELTVLDLCAAPGGKSTLLSSLLNRKSILVSNEIIKSRSELLSYQLAKWGECNTVVTNSEAGKLSRAMNKLFDIVVVDAPCSGSGLFRKQPEAIAEWSPAAVTACSVRQKDILNDILPALKNDGLLFYSTCSFSEEENELIVKWLCREHQMEVLPISTELEWGVQKNEFGCRFYPHLTRTEGFFCSLLKKADSSESGKGKRRKSNGDLPFKGNIPNIHADGRPVRIINRQFHLMSEQVNEFITMYGSSVYLKKAGIVLGELKGTDLVPDHELALANNVKHDFQIVDVDLETALSFLRKKGPPPLNAKKGFTLLTYRGLGIGWIKILDGRVNNYLPGTWRILN